MTPTGSSDPKPMFAESAIHQRAARRSAGRIAPEVERCALVVATGGHLVGTHRALGDDVAAQGSDAALVVGEIAHAGKDVDFWCVSRIVAHGETLAEAV